MSRYVCVTGAAGFIGQHLVRALAARGDHVYAVDALTYAADPARFAELCATYPAHIVSRFVDANTLARLPDVDAIVHLAASTHVDNSLNEAEEFVANNVGTTAHLLELARAKAQHGMPHFVLISTDEVYGAIVRGGAASESSPFRPTSPYAASKAAADLLVRAWGATYGVPYAILRPTNCYGVGQHPEKLIPKTLRCLQSDQPIPIHGTGEQTRSWLAVEDAVSAILLTLDRPVYGVYNIGGNTEASVRDVVRAIREAYGAGAALATREAGRPACDMRYAVDDAALRALGWAPQGSLWRDLPLLVQAARSQWRW
jgi:dTDP-glucose 4,6-dehydratase